MKLKLTPMTAIGLAMLAVGGALAYDARQHESRRREGTDRDDGPHPLPGQNASVIGGLGPSRYGGGSSDGTLWPDGRGPHPNQSPSPAGAGGSAYTVGGLPSFVGTGLPDAQATMPTLFTIQPQAFRLEFGASPDAQQRRDKLIAVYDWMTRTVRHYTSDRGQNVGVKDDRSEQGLTIAEVRGYYDAVRAHIASVPSTVSVQDAAHPLYSDRGWAQPVRIWNTPSCTPRQNVPRSVTLGALISQLDLYRIRSIRAANRNTIPSYRYADRFCS